MKQILVNLGNATEIICNRCPFVDWDCYVCLAFASKPLHLLTDEIERLPECKEAEKQANRMIKLGKPKRLVFPGLAPEERQTCTWRCTDREASLWESDCGVAWTFTTDDPPSKHGIVYCHKCGKRVKVKGNTDEKI